MKLNYQVIVIGGGSAGAIAALASARSGSKTLLIEESMDFGGTNTRSLVGPIVPFIGEFNQQIVGGIPDDIIKELVSLGGSLGHIDDPIDFAHGITPVDFNVMKLVLSRRMKEQENLTVRLGESLISVDESENKVTSIYCKDRNNVLTEYSASVYIDATGDADLVAMSSSPFEYGRESDQKCQPMTTVFSLSNVDLEKVRDDVAANPSNFVVGEVIRNGERMGYVAISGYMNEVRTSKDFPINRDRLLFFEGVHKNEVYVNTTRILNKNNLISDDYKSATLEGNKQVLELHEWLKANIVAFKNSFIKDVGEIGVRESRRIVGKKQLTAKHVLGGETQNKSIAVGSYPIDIHAPDSSLMDFIEEQRVKNYEIDLDMIRPRSLTNVMVAGRSISATHEAHASSRVSATCMAIGQSAGVIASISAQSGHEIDNLDYNEIEQKINAFGGVTKRLNKQA